MEHIKEVTPKEVEEIISNEDVNTEIIDVREDEEVASGMIEGAKHIPLGNIPDVADELDKEKDYILVCRSGRRSMNAALYLDEIGFKVRNMSGGMLEWGGEVII
ncbi:Rhodanese-related sulfurtransferase [Oceanobacillus limi]|uniref:Rhodanese-related sulfurtransferase n=1 Tax=Oceanobacillus limi TaxID=930131 RepID=A0A1I0DK04_9BACI|nr:rhodanese-like domain-containing protein [Oceanobacillus limi]SET32803.1 Rhodanese-related sulfurtransferase [Oceanobacillus limi]